MIIGRRFAVLLAMGLIVVGLLMAGSPDAFLGQPATTSASECTLSGNVVDMCGRAIPFVAMRVVLTAPPPNDPGPLPGSVVSNTVTDYSTAADSRGYYTLKIPTSTYKYTVTATQGRFSASSWVYATGVHATLNLVMDIEAYRVIIRPVSDGKAVTGAKVILGIKTMQVWAPVEKAQFDGVSPGETSLLILSPTTNEYLDNSFIVEKNNMDVTIDLVAGTVTPNPNPSNVGLLTGKVTDAETGDAIAGATIFLEVGSVGVSTLSGPDGTYRVEAAAGSYVVRCVKEKYNTTYGNRTLMLNNPQTLDFEMEYFWKPNTRPAYSITDYVILAAPFALAAAILYFVVRRR